MPPETLDVRFIEARDRPIVRATDLGSVQVLKHGNVFLLTDPFGDIHPDSRGLGLYAGDTRTLSCSVLRVGGDRPVLLQGSAGGNYRGSIQLTNPTADRNPDAKVHPADALVGRTIGISRDRLISADALEERVKIVNHASRVETIAVDLEFGFDAADIFEVRGYPRRSRGTLLPVAATTDRLTFRYDGLDGRRRATHLAFSEEAVAVEPVAAEVEAADPIDSGATVRFRWSFTLGPGEAGELRWVVWETIGAIPEDGADAAGTTGTARTATAGGAGNVDTADLFPEAPRVSADEGAAAYHAWERGTTTISSDHELFNLVVERSVADLRLLVNEGPDAGERYVAAGVPWFTTLFGRDSLITALQSVAFRPQIAVEALTVLAAHQATAMDPDRDAEPGKILHELRTGEMAGSGELPHTPYYGSVDSTPLWLILLGETYDWTGDRALVDRLWPNALAALDWIDRYGDRDGDGFVEYERRTDGGLLNQGWKDSSDAIRDRDGNQAVPPIALAEVQGYVFAAKRRMAGLARIRGEGELADRLDRDASLLQDRFEAAFWVEDQRYYALALDRDKRPADAVGSNAGQCLWTGIVAPERAQDVVDRLLGPTMSSGWGIRTYAADQAGYNPIGYHTGTVWPHDTSLIAAGMKRYGFDDAANRLVEPGPGGGPAVPGVPPPRAVLRVRPRRCPPSGAISRGLLAAGVGRRQPVPVPRHDARAPTARRPRRTRTPAPAPAGLAREGHAHEPPDRGGVGGPAVPSMARDHERGGPAQGRRDRRHDPPVTTVGELLREGADALTASGSESPRLDAELLLGHAIGIDRTGVVAHSEAPVGADAEATYRAGIARRVTGEPVAYIRGIKEFYGLAFTVDRRALIPRPETERLVELAEAEVMGRLAAAARPAGSPPIRVADVGTGSGAIAIALVVALRRRRAEAEMTVLATDVSAEALDLARENAVGHAAADRLGFLETDLLPPVVVDPYDLVLANLPYVRHDVVPELPVAASFEPVLALDGGADGLEVIGRLLERLPDGLAEGGVALLEIGADQGDAIVALVQATLPGWSCVVERDLAGLPRVARVVRGPDSAAGGFGPAGSGTPPAERPG